MASKQPSSKTSAMPLPSAPSESPTPTEIPAEAGFNVAKWRQTPEAQKLVAWILDSYERAKQDREQKKLQWATNLAMFFGQQHAKAVLDPRSNERRMITPRAPYYKQRKTINRTRSFVRTEHSRFLSAIPQAMAVPSTAEDQDVRAAYAAEQAWQSLSDAQKLRTHYTKASWWMILTGVGFIKEWWDNGFPVDKKNGVYGNIRFGSVTPFHLFVPDLKEQEIEDQPFIINAYSKPVEWCRYQYAAELEGVNLVPTVSSSSSILEDQYMNLSSPSRASDAVNIYEVWCKPGATPLLPSGGVIVMIDRYIVGVTLDGFPYEHGQYPFAKLEHMPNGTFYADSPLVDTNPLQREYNNLRTQISEAGTRMAQPAYIAPRGSIVPNAITNEPGQVILYKPGFQPPQPMTLTPLPQYFIDQQETIKQDWEDITGQHEVSKGDAPTGVTAGTAINYLQEKDNQFLTPEYQSVEDAYEKLAQQGLSLFVQYVDMPRKIKTIGADGAFDTMLLQGSDIANGTDIRIQRGSSVGESQAAKEAKIMDMVSMGLLMPDQALKLLEVGGAQKILDTLSVAEKKAQRENTKMKMLTPEMISEATEQFAQVTASGELAAADFMQETEDGIPESPMPIMPGLVPVDDFDIHEVHIEVHNKFRMGQEYETLSDEVKAQFAAHVAEHQQYLSYAQMETEMGMPEGGGPEGPSIPEGEGDATMAPEGAAPMAPPTEGV